MKQMWLKYWVRVSVVVSSQSYPDVCIYDCISLFILRIIGTIVSDIIEPYSINSILNIYIV